MNFRIEKVSNTTLGEIKDWDGFFAISEDGYTIGELGGGAGYASELGCGCCASFDLDGDTKVELYMVVKEGE